MRRDQDSRVAGDGGCGGDGRIASFLPELDGDDDREDDVERGADVGWDCSNRSRSGSERLRRPPDRAWEDAGGGADAEVDVDADS